MESQIWIGTVSSVNAEEGHADVLFKDKEDIVKPSLPILNTGQKMPEVGDMVVVAFTGTSGDGIGIVLGRFYNTSLKPVKDVGNIQEGV